MEREYDLVCDAGDGSPLHPDSTAKTFKRLAAKAEFSSDSRLHDLRHAVAVATNEESGPVVAVSAFLGHSSPAFTASIYQHYTDALGEVVLSALETRMGRAAGGEAP